MRILPAALLILFAVGCDPSMNLLHGYHKNHASQLASCHQVLQTQDVCTIDIVFSPDIEGLRTTLDTSVAEYDLFHNYTSLWTALQSNIDTFTIGEHYEKQILEKFLLQAKTYEPQLRAILVTHKDSIDRQSEDFQAIHMTYSSYATLILRGFLHLEARTGYEATIKQLQPQMPIIIEHVLASNWFLFLHAQTDELRAFYDEQNELIKHYSPVLVGSES